MNGGYGVGNQRRGKYRIKNLKIILAIRKNMSTFASQTKKRRLQPTRK